MASERSRWRASHDGFKVVAQPPLTLRRAYLASLVEPQELYLETRVKAGATWAMGNAAYGVVHEGALVEFFVADRSAADSLPIFDALLTSSGAQTFLCKSFDAQLMHVALARPATVSSVGLLFRRYVMDPFEVRSSLSFRPATATDVGLILRENDGFFENVAELEAYRLSDGLLTLHRGDELLGCGLMRRVVAERQDYDIGMWIRPRYRRQGFGTHIVSHLKRWLIERRLRPICGCDQENEASRKALEAAGFMSEHRLLQIQPR